MPSFAASSLVGFGSKGIVWEGVCISAAILADVIFLSVDWGSSLLMLKMQSNPSPTKTEPKDAGRVSW